MATKQPTFHLSLPTKAQVLTLVQRVLLLFVATFVGFWLKTSDPLSTSALWGAAVAAGAAVYSLVESLLTTL